MLFCADFVTYSSVNSLIILPIYQHVSSTNHSSCNFRASIASGITSFFHRKKAKSEKHMSTSSVGDQPDGSPKPDDSNPVPPTRPERPSSKTKSASVKEDPKSRTGSMTETKSRSSSGADNTSTDIPAAEKTIPVIKTELEDVPGKHSKDNSECNKTNTMFSYNYL